MNGTIFRAFVEKKPNFNVEAEKLLFDFKKNLGVKGLSNVRIINRYDIAGIHEGQYEEIKKSILSETNVDEVFDENIDLNGKTYFAVEYLKGQYDQRADSAAQCIQIITEKEKPLVKNAKIIVLEGDVTSQELDKIKAYYINSVDSCEALMEKPSTLEEQSVIPEDVKIIEDFIDKSKDELERFLEGESLAMSLDDLLMCRDYFKVEKRNPTITEIKVIDTYWSDHCRHTTFNTVIEEVDFEEGKYVKPIKEAYNEYLEDRNIVYGNRHKDKCLMDIAVIGMKKLRKEGKLQDLDQSEEINACSIVVPVDVDGKIEKWLVMFKNETHNHPTEIEPFGGASTCLGGAIRDPLSGRSYVYQAMRVTGSGDPTKRVEDTLKGKLPQSKITKGAARGYSSYGNQIGLATGMVNEVYHEDFVAKRMEIGAVIGAAPLENVIREQPTEGDLIILLGGRTGRDGCGGASGSSKEHDEKSLYSCGAEVQKGNAPTERKIQRLFRDSKVTTLIKRCNDFGAGGVSVAIGELSEGLDINLDLVPKKYEGLDGTELSISESQERMAVVVRKEDADKFIKYAEDENLEAVVVAEVTNLKRMRMFFNGKAIVDLSREFLDTNGAKQCTKIYVENPKEDSNFFKKSQKPKDLKAAWLSNLSNLNVCSQKGLVEMFDSTVGAGTVLMPFGGKYQSTPTEVMSAKIPVLNGETNTASLMSYGYNPYIGKWSPFHGAAYALIEAITKIVAVGGDYKNIRLTLQEYFEKLGKNPAKWGKPFAALLGALHVQDQLNIPAIGGKDSMSGTFKELNVPPTLVAFAVNTINIEQLVTSEFKKKHSKVVILKTNRDELELPKFSELKANFKKVNELIKNGKVLAAHTVKNGGISEAISKMCFGNKIGFSFQSDIRPEELFLPLYGSIILELNQEEDLDKLFEQINYELLGSTEESEFINIFGTKISLEEALNAWENPLENVFNTKYKEEFTQEEEFCRKYINTNKEQGTLSVGTKNNIKSSLLIKVPKPKVLIPVFPGSNCEYECMTAFKKAGAEVETLVFNNLSSSHIHNSIEKMVEEIKKSQIIMIPGGFSAGDEPEGSGKFIGAVFRNEQVKEAVMDLLKHRDGLMLGVCNGLQALIKLGLVPYGEIKEIGQNSPTLTFNTIGRHISHIANTKIVSTKSPWFSMVKEGDIHKMPLSHGEGRFYAEKEVVDELFKNNQVATQYVYFNGNPTYDIRFNPNGSVCAIEGITSPDGRVLGKMGHSERIGKGLYKNVQGDYDQKLFLSGVSYFK